MTKPTTPMATTISSQDISLTPHDVRWTTGSDATERGGTTAPARGTSSGLTIRPPGLVLPAAAPGTRAPRLVPPTSPRSDAPAGVARRWWRRHHDPTHRANR